MITEGPHRQQLRLLVDRLPDGLLDAAIAFLSKLTSGTFDLPTETANDDLQPIDDYHDEYDGEEYIESCKWCGDEFLYLGYGETCNSCLKLGRD